MIKKLIINHHFEFLNDIRYDNSITNIIEKYYISNENIFEYKYGYYKFNLLHLLVYHNNFKLIEYVFDKQKEYFDLIYDIDINGNTPFHISCINNNYKLIKYFVERISIEVIVESELVNPLELITNKEILRKLNKYFNNNNIDKESKIGYKNKYFFDKLNLENVNNGDNSKDNNEIDDIYTLLQKIKNSNKIDLDNKIKTESENIKNTKYDNNIFEKEEISNNSKNNSSTIKSCKLELIKGNSDISNSSNILEENDYNNNNSSSIRSSNLEPNNYNISRSMKKLSYLNKYENSKNNNLITLGYLHDSNTINDNKEISDNNIYSNTNNNDSINSIKFKHSKVLKQPFILKSDSDDSNYVENYYVEDNKLYFNNLDDSISNTQNSTNDIKLPQSLIKHSILNN